MVALLSHWKKFRSHYWLALAFDLGCLLLVLWALHVWQTRALPIGEPAVPTQLPLLSAVVTGSPGAVMDGKESSGGPAPGQRHAVQPGATGVMYFFAPWCGICRHSIGNLDQMVQDGSVDWATAIALDYGSTAEVSEFVADTGINLPVLLGSDQTANDWAIRGFPTYFVIDARGNISSRSVGYSTALGIRLRVWLARLNLE